MTEVSLRKDYSQGGEQTAILAAFNGYGRNGRFLEIGAWSAETISNTRALVEMGWSGYMVEPSPGPMRNLLNVYGQNKKIVLIQAAVGFENKLVQMAISDDGLSTSDQASYDKWKEQANYLGMVWVPVLTLEALTNQFGHFDFWSIDAEGLSADIFLHALRMNQRPRCFCVEHDNRIVEISQEATKAGYSITYMTQENLVMVL